MSGRPQTGLWSDDRHFFDRSGGSLLTEPNIKKPNPYRAPLMEAELSSTESSTPLTVVRRSSQWSLPVTVAFALLMPGSPVWLIRRDSTGFVWFAMLLGAIPFSLAFFGPFWGEVLFARTPYAETGLYPFLGSCVLVPAISVVKSIQTYEQFTSRGERD